MSNETQGPVGTPAPAPTPGPAQPVDQATRFTVGDALSMGFGSYFKRFLPYTMLAFLMLSPIYIIQYFYFISSLGRLRNPNASLMFTIPLGLILEGLLAAALIYAVVMQLRGEKVGIFESVARGLNRFFPVVGTAILRGILVVIGLVLLIVPGVVLIVMFWVALPSAVVERNNPIDAINRSLALTKGRRWAIFGLFVILIVLYFVLSLVFSFIIKAIIPSLISSFSISGILLFLLGINLLVQSVTTALSAIVGACSYSLLVAEKEGVDIDRIAAVFD
jgi:hypothetical protein